MARNQSASLALRPLRPAWPREAMPQAQSSNSVNLPAFPGLDDTVRAHLGMHLRHLYSDVIQAESAVHTL